MKNIRKNVNRIFELRYNTKDYWDFQLSQDNVQCLVCDDVVSGDVVATFDFDAVSGMCSEIQWDCAVSFSGDICDIGLTGYDNRFVPNFSGETFNLGLSDANLSKLELCNLIKKHIPKFEILESDIGQDIDKRDYIVSNEKIESRGFKPEYSIDDGVLELIKLFRYLIPSESMRNF